MRTNPRTVTAAASVVLLGAAGLTAGCGSQESEPSESGHHAASPQASATPPSPGRDTTSPESSPSTSAPSSSRSGAPEPGFTSKPTSGQGASGGQVLAIRTGTHDGYDRVVVDLRGQAPQWRAHYQRRFVQDGSGEPVKIRGKAGLLVVLQAAGHDQNYKPVYQGPRLARPGLPVLRQWAVTGDFEGQFSLGLALARKAPYRVFTLNNPARLVVDVKK